MKKFIDEIKQIKRNMKIFSLRTSNTEYKVKIQKLINLTKNILPGTKKLPLRIEILEHNIKNINEMPKCNNSKCDNTIYTFDTSKKRFCSSRCQSIYNNKNLTKESRMKAAASRNYEEIQTKRLNTMKNDIIQGNNAHQRSAEKSAKSRDYSEVSRKATITRKLMGHYERLAFTNSNRMLEIQQNGESLATNIWNNYWDNISKERIKLRNKKIRATNELLGNWISEDKISDWELYSKRVRRLTENVYSDNIHIIDPNNIRENLVYDLDHIKSVKYGFDNNIPIHLIACVENLQILNSIENRKKGSK